MLSVLWIRAIQAWMLHSCHDLVTKLIINKKAFQRRSGLCWHSLNVLGPGHAYPVVKPSSMEQPTV